MEDRRIIKLKNRLKDTIGLSSPSILSAGLLAAIVTCITPTLVVLEVAHRHGFTQEQIVSWLFGSYVFGGLMGVILALMTKQPINGTMSVPAAVFLGTSFYSLTLNEAVFAYAGAGVLIALVGLFKLYDKVLKWIKLEVTMAMFAGVMLHYAVNIVSFTSDHLLYGGLAIGAFLLAMRFGKLIPPVLVAVVVVTVVLGIEGRIPYEVFRESNWISPALVMWDVDWSLLFSISLPLMLIVLSGEVTIGTSILKAEGYDPPVNKMTLYTGVGTIIGSFFGAHNVSTSGVPIGVLADPSTGPKEKRYLAALWASLLTVLFGVGAHYVLIFFSIYPEEVLVLFVGFVLVPILIKALTQAFGSGAFHYGAFTSFIVALSNISIFEIGAPFWSIIFGTLVSLFIEKKDFKIIKS